jgi:hypothetical protein
MSGSIGTPTVTSIGAVPQTPEAINAAIVAAATAQSPGLTILPAGLIEDMSSTATGAALQIDQAQVDAINSLTPYGANPFTLLALGQIYLGQGSTNLPATNTAVYVVFSGTVGFLVNPGFLVSDGTYQYAVIDGGVIASGGASVPLFCQATISGSWAVPANTVTTLVTSAPSGVTLTATNPLAGTPGGAAETQAQFAARVLQAGLVASTGMTAYLKAYLGQVSGVQPSLVSVRQQVDGGWEVIVGGTADPYAIAAAILDSLFDVSTLVGSILNVTGITNANPGVVTTGLNHGYTTGQVVNIAGAVGISGINGTPLTITVITNKTFSIGIDTTSSGVWTSGGVVTPNFRNQSINLNNYPDTYTIPFVVPPVQTVTVDLTWNTPSPNYVSPTAVSALAQPAIAAYINSIPVGAPINVFELQDVFVASIVSIISTVLITRIVFAVYINSILTNPGAGSEAIYGDPESYFSCSATSITIVQG